MTKTAGRLTRDEARARADLVSDVAYEVELVLDGDPETFGSRTVVRFRTARPGASSHIDLSADSVESVTLNGRELSHADVVDEHRILLPDLAEENELRIIARAAYQNTGVGLHRMVDPADGSVYLHSQFEPFDAHRVLACFDQPDLKAPLTLTVEAPSEWVVVSNSPVTASGDGRWEFATTPRLSPYLYAVVAGPFDVVTDEHDGIPLGLYTRQSMHEYLDEDELFTLTRDGLDFFADVFDQRYPFEKYDQLFVPEFNFGAMENPGCVTFSEGYLFRGKVTEAQRESRANTIYHEMAHMWFGDLVTMRWWGDLWLNESFATFMGYLTCERASRFREAWVTFADHEKAWARREDQLPTTHPIVSDAESIEEVFQNFDGITYAKGASVLRQLVAWVGEDAFLAGCRRYFDRYAWDNAELEDFLGELEAASDRDLQTWAKEWLQTSGVNTLEVQTTTDDAGRYRAVEVVQEAPEEQPTLRSHRVTVGLYDLDGDRLGLRRRVAIDVTGATTDVPDLVGETVADLVIVDDEDLTFAKRRLDERSLDTITDHLAHIDNPLARSLCWSTAWDMVRDAVMPAGRFVEVVRRNVLGEDEIGVLETLQGRTLVAVQLYGDHDRLEQRLEVLADDARAAMETADTDGDHQLAWARQWIACATTAEQTDAVRDLLEGRLTFEGLEMDTELRWRAVRALAAAGAIGESRIDAEHDRDRTDLGERNAAAALAARPDPDAKQTAWERVVGDRTVSHSLMKAIMRGFTQRTQAELLRPYVGRYFDVVGEIFEHRDLEVALAFAHAMYPSAVVEQDTLARTDEYLERKDVPGPLRRTLLEQRDTLVRALRAREVDREDPSGPTLQSSR